MHVVTKPNSALQEAKSVINDLSEELKGAKAENTALKTKLDTATAEVTTAQSRTEKVQKDADNLKTWGVGQQEEATKWFQESTKKDKIIATRDKHIHYLKNIIGVLAAVAGALFGMFAMRFVPPIYAAYALALPLVGVFLAYGAVWLFL